VTLVDIPDHPAKFSEPILVELGRILEAELDRFVSDQVLEVLDPFAGVGGIHSLAGSRVQTTGIELEPEWAATHPRTYVGDATGLPAHLYGRFHAVITSPCYGNRMADLYDGRDGSKRYTYRISLGRLPTDGSSAGLQWGMDYRSLHLRAWCEVWKALRPGGLLVVNVSDHIRDGEPVPVVEWHAKALVEIGFQVDEVRTVNTRRMRNGANHEARVPGERIIVARKPQ
jgi:tRNA G10  N-methylase Trm11